MGIRMRVTGLIPLLFLFLIAGFDGVYSYSRPPPRKTIFTPQSDDDSSPQQVCVPVIYMHLLISEMEKMGGFRVISIWIMFLCDNIWIDICMYCPCMFWKCMWVGLVVRWRRQQVRLPKENENRWALANRVRKPIWDWRLGVGSGESWVGLLMWVCLLSPILRMSRRRFLKCFITRRWTLFFLMLTENTIFNLTHFHTYDFYF